MNNKPIAIESVWDYPRPPRLESTPRRILIVRLGAMGDIIHTLPAASALALTFPTAEIVWASPAEWENLDLVDGLGDILARAWQISGARS